MRVLITTQVFPPEIHPTAVMARELAEGLARRGIEVVVAAGLPHHPSGRVAAGYGHSYRVVERVGGYRVVRFWHPTTPNRSFAARLAVMTSQMLATATAAVASGRPHVVLSFGGPPLIGPVLSGLLATMWRVPLITVIHDLYPDVAIENGALRSRTVARLARFAERLQYWLTDRLVVLGETTRNLIVATRSVDPGRVEVVPVWLDADEVKPGLRDNEWRREQGIGPERFVVLYAGTAGIISGAEMLADVARQLPAEVLLLVVGGGSAWEHLRTLEKRRELPPTLRLLPYQPRERLSEVQACSDLSLLTLLPGRGRTSVPSKLQAYMAAGRPVLATVDDDCDTAHMILRNRFGRVVPYGDARHLAQAIEALRARPVVLSEWGRNARATFELEHAKESILERYSQMLQTAAGAVA